MLINDYCRGMPCLFMSTGPVLQGLYYRLGLPHNQCVEPPFCPYRGIMIYKIEKYCTPFFALCILTPKEVFRHIKNIHVVPFRVLKLRKQSENDQYPLHYYGVWKFARFIIIYKPVYKSVKIT